MLKSLSVSNLAVIERADVAFAPGLNVITGETGAGKSVLMGALDLVLGARAESSAVRDGAVEASVEAVFVDARGHETRFRRTVTREGRSRAWIDDESVALGELKEAARRLVDIHGPRANDRLLDESFQLKVLDDFGSIARAKYDALYTAWAEASARLAALRDETKTEDLDFLRFQVNELDEAALTDEDETIAERHAAAAHAQEIVEEGNAVTEALGGDEGVITLLSSLQPRFLRMARHFPAAEAWSTEAESLVARAEDLSRAIADALSRLDAGEEDMATLDARLTTINRLKRKYLASAPSAAGESDVSRLLKILAEKKTRLTALENRDETLATLEKECTARLADLRTAGAAITKARTKAGASFSKAIERELHALGFLQAKFSVRLEALDAPTASGLDRVVFLFEPNPGEAARPLAEIASSGEIARVMLALKVVSSDASLRGTGHPAQSAKNKAPDPSPTTLVFDEIDANIGGEVGKVVGEKMREVAKGRQVIAITHLPQSAVYGARHLVVTKGVTASRTKSHVAEVTGDARVREIARMLGGEKLTSVVKTHAAELLRLANEG